MNNSEDASTQPPSIKPSPLMSINDNHAGNHGDNQKVHRVYVCVGWGGGGEGTRTRALEL